MRKIKFVYTCEFEGTITVEDNATPGDIEDAACDISIPEDDDSKYVVNSFDLKRNDDGSMITRDEKKVEDE